MSFPMRDALELQKVRIRQGFQFGIPGSKCPSVVLEIVYKLLKPRKTENWRTQTPYKVVLCGVFLYLIDSIICNVLALLFA